jgi:hypothetical protein
MELFKERKKSRKKKGKGSKCPTTDTGTDGTGAGGTSGTAVGDKTNATDNSNNIQVEVQNLVKMGSKGAKEKHQQQNDVLKKNNGGGGKENTKTDLNDIVDVLSTDAATVAVTSKKSSSSSKKKKRNNDAKVERGSSTSSVVSETCHERQQEEQQQQQKQQQSESINQGPGLMYQTPPSAPPGLNTMPPPGFQVSSSTLNCADNNKMQNNTCNEHQSIPNQELNKPPDDQIIPPPTSKSTIIPDDDNNLFMNPLSISPSIHQRYIVINESDRPISSLNNKPSLAVAAAKAFVDLYYPHVTHGLSSDLSCYYTPHAQKSISVGGAHHVVATRSDIMLQLMKFSGSNFLVRGVVSQDTFDNKGAHVMVTGIVQTNTSGLTSFAHSVSLVKTQHNSLLFPSTSDLEFSFQIHNDAMSLLTVSDMIANEQG